MREIDTLVERLAQSFEDVVVAYAPVLLPIFAIKIELLVRTRTEMGAAELAVLRSVQAEVTTPGDVEGFLGLESRYFRHLLLSLEQQTMLLEADQPAKLFLTERGHAALEIGTREDDRIEEYRIYFDPLLRKVVIPNPRPIHPADAGSTILLGESCAIPPEETEIEPADIQSSLMAAGARREMAGRQVLRITSILERKIRYQQVIAIVVRNPVSNALTVQIASGSQLSEERSRALVSLRDVRVGKYLVQCDLVAAQAQFEECLKPILTAEVVGAAKRLKKELVNARVRRTPIARQYENEPSTANGEALGRLETEIARLELEAASAAGLIQSGIDVHRKIEAAFVNAKSHILIVVPGSLLEFPPEYLRLALAATTRGVSVTVAHLRGVSGEDEPASRVAVADLKQVAKTVYWETYEKACPLFTITWDARWILLVSRPPFATVGSPLGLVPIFSTLVEDAATLKKLFPHDIGSSLQPWAMTARRPKKTDASFPRWQDSKGKKVGRGPQQKAKSRTQQRKRRGIDSGKK